MKQEATENEKEASVVPVKRSRTSDDETDPNMKKKVQRSDLNAPLSPKASIKKGSSSTPSTTPKKSLKSTKSTSPKKQTPKKKKANYVKESEKITNYFTNLS